MHSAETAAAAELEHASLLQQLRGVNGLLGFLVRLVTPLVTVLLLRARMIDGQDISWSIIVAPAW